MKQSKGFTLLELLVTIGIIGILASIAIPQFNQYQRRAFDARSKADLVSAATAQDAYFIDWSIYKSCADSTGCAAVLPELRVSKGISMATTAVGTQYFIMTASHPQSMQTWTWDSDNGGLQ
ncbi:MAG: prepilin-type N-terminal cleavage/methylation domain-containing protein [bacterium]|nr:prepilin-type N-terminal cleavage/methylation domain-containing protein [bacterium]